LSLRLRRHPDPGVGDLEADGYRLVAIARDTADETVNAY